MKAENKNWKIMAINAWRWLGCWFIAGILLLGAKISPVSIEFIYSRGFYPLIATVFRWFWGWFSWPVGQILTPLVLIGVIIIMIRRWRRRPKYKFWLLLRDIAGFAGSIFLLFLLLWGLNYYRLPFADTASLEIRATGAGELQELLLDLGEKLPSLREACPKDENGMISLPDRHQAYHLGAALAYPQVEESYPWLKFSPAVTKPALFSEFLCRCGIGGFYFAFSGETNLNTKLLPLALPFSILHEEAHRRGYAREDEANFLAFLAGRQHPEPVFAYSAYFSAYVYAGNALSKKSPELYREARTALPEEVLADLRSVQDFWRSYQGRLQDTADRINDAYLRVNGQTDGAASYGRMVDLMLAAKRKGVL
ncbi:MAG: DUF3810 domain-containing protein [Clostridiales bacterium]|nr:DUF3810 domain-containing protein [Clostridiales bacterium]